MFTTIGVAYYTKESKINVDSSLKVVVDDEKKEEKNDKKKKVKNEFAFEEENQIRRFFSKGIDKFPIVENNHLYQ